MEVKERIAALRDVMRAHGWDAVLFLSGDPHQNEYLPEYYKSRAWISGFTGSAGTVVITQDHGGLWTDARYFLQADQQLVGSGVELHKLQVQGAPEYGEWLAAHLPAGAVVCCDGNTISVGAADALRGIFAEKKIRVSTDSDPVDTLWKDRPAKGSSTVFDLPVKYAGVSRTDKINKIRSQVQSAGATHYLVTALDDIAWLLNLRGQDIQCNPVFLSYVLIQPESVVFFVDDSRISAEILRELDTQGIHTQRYEGVKAFLSSLTSDDAVMINPGSLSETLSRSLSHTRVIAADSLIKHAKSIKNETEQKWIREAMIKDGVALTKFFIWLEKELAAGHTPAEYDLAQQLMVCRGTQSDYIGESFDAIVGYRGNGAIIHYKPEQETAAQVRPGGVLLVDSGGQYLDGTTDITRTITLGDPTAHEIHMNTLVLKGHIGLAMARFPEGTRGVQLDILARQALWQEGYNYLHGTGHGVGFFLNVHEPPQGFVNTLVERGTTPMAAGQLSSNEPGYYEKDAFGIRIENLVLCQLERETEFGKFYHFETVTLFPIDKALIDKGLLSPAELQWLNDYHQRVYERLSPGLDMEEQNWLKDKCNAL